MLLTVICVFPVEPGAEWAQLTAPQAPMQHTYRMHWARAAYCKSYSGREIVLLCVSPGENLARNRNRNALVRSRSVLPRSAFRCVRRWGVSPEDPRWDKSSLGCPRFLPLSVTSEWTIPVCRTCTASLCCTTAFFARWTPTLLRWNSSGITVLWPRKQWDPATNKTTWGMHTAQPLQQPG